jgi:hypothetical protein
VVLRAQAQGRVYVISQQAQRPHCNLTLSTGRNNAMHYYLGCYLGWMKFWDTTTPIFKARVSYLPRSYPHSIGMECG